MFLEKTQLPIAQLGKILEALFLDGNVNNRTFPRRTAPSLMKTLSMGRDASIPQTASWKVVYVSLYIQYLSQETLQNPTNSTEILCGFRADFAKLLCS